MASPPSVSVTSAWPPAVKVVTSEGAMNARNTGGAFTVKALPSPSLPAAMLKILRRYSSRSSPNSSWMTYQSMVTLLARAVMVALPEGQTARTAPSASEKSGSRAVGLEPRDRRQSKVMLLVTGSPTRLTVAVTRVGAPAVAASSSASATGLIANERAPAAVNKTVAQAWSETTTPLTVSETVRRMYHGEAEASCG